MDTPIIGLTATGEGPNVPAKVEGGRVMGTTDCLCTCGLCAIYGHPFPKVWWTDHLKSCAERVGTEAE